jgi:hypothetical protein
MSDETSRSGSRARVRLRSVHPARVGDLTASGPSRPRSATPLRSIPAHLSEAVSSGNLKPSGAYL